MHCQAAAAGCRKFPLMLGEFSYPTAHDSLCFHEVLLLPHTAGHAAAGIRTRIASSFQFLMGSSNPAIRLLPRGKNISNQYKIVMSTYAFAALPFWHPSQHEQPGLQRELLPLLLELPLDMLFSAPSTSGRVSPSHVPHPNQRHEEKAEIREQSLGATSRT